MPERRRARDLELLDALGAFDPVPFEGTVWRVVREGRDPIQGHPSAGRWDPGRFDVVYTALDSDGAQAEMSFHLSRQPVFPSKIKFKLHRISVRATKLLRLEGMAQLQRLRVDPARYSEVLYAPTQAIGDGAEFLGLQGIIAPNARWPCLNLVLFTDHFTPTNLTVVSSEHVDIAAWNKRRRSVTSN